MEIWKGVAFVGLLALAAAFFMPWITVGASSFLGSVSSSFSMVDLCRELMARSSLVRALQPVFGTKYNPYTGTQNLPVDAELESRLWMATILATVFYAIAVAYAVVFFIRKSALYLLSSAVLAMASWVIPLLFIDLLE